MRVFANKKWKTDT